VHGPNIEIRDIVIRPGTSDWELPQVDAVNLINGNYTIQLSWHGTAISPPQALSPGGTIAFPGLPLNLTVAPSTDVISASPQMQIVLYENGNGTSATIRSGRQPDRSSADRPRQAVRRAGQCIRAHWHARNVITFPVRFRTTGTSSSSGAG